MATNIKYVVADALKFAREYKRKIKRREKHMKTVAALERERERAII